MPRVTVIAQPYDARTLGRSLAERLEEGHWASFRAVVAFAKSTGVRHLLGPLDTFLASGAEATVSVGMDLDGTSLEGLQDLWRVLDGRGSLYVFKEGQGGQARTFHPKGYLFEADGRAVAYIGSGNLTQGGLFTNHELTLETTFDFADEEDVEEHSVLHDAIARWQQPGPACRLIDADLIRALYDDGDLLSEVAIAAAKRAAVRATRQGQAASTAQRPPLFGSSGAGTRPPAPPALPSMRAPVVTPPSTPPPRRSTRQTTTPTLVRPAPHQTFLIQVRPHHNGEIFLSKTAVDDDPGFFGWPFAGWTVPKRSSNSPYPMALPDPQVEIVVHDVNGNPIRTVTHSLNVVYYTPKSEIRMTVPHDIISDIPQMSLLAMTRAPTASLDYRLEFYPPNCTAPAAQALAAKLVNRLPSGGAPESRYYGWA